MCGFIELLREHANKHGPVALHLDQPWRGCGGRYFVVEQSFIFDLDAWQFVGWIRNAFPQPMSSLPEVMQWVLAARGWEELSGHTASMMTECVKQPTLFPLCGEDHDVADRHLDWAYLCERRCWINRELERCACPVCYPLRDEGDWSMMQVAHGHCVYCRCATCRCKLSNEVERPSEVVLVAPRDQCGCVVCVARGGD